MSYQPRKWQEKAFAIASHANASDKKEVVLVNACVGSGKTAVASYALGDFIAKNKDKKTFQMFVTPRIKLCSQQVKSVQDDIRSMFGYEDGKEYQILRRDCSVDNGVNDKYVEALTGRKNGIPYVELHDFMLDRLRKMLKDPVNKKLWNINKRVLMNIAFGNPEATEFFMTHLSKKVLYQLSK